MSAKGEYVASVHLSEGRSVEIYGSKQDVIMAKYALERALRAESPATLDDILKELKDINRNLHRPL